MNSHLHQKLSQTKLVIEEALDMYPSEDIFVAWSAGKDSTLMLKLILDVCRTKNRKAPIALDIYQNDEFEEIISHRDRLVRDWNIDLLVVSNPDVLKQVYSIGDQIQVKNLSTTNQATLKDINFEEASFPWLPDSPVCTHLLKTIPINQAIIGNNIQAMFTGIRWDEHGARENETYFSERTSPDHMRIHPLLHFSERDIWDATFALDIPFNELYKKGYRSIGTKYGTKRNSHIPAWEQDLEATSERECRSSEKEKMMEQLRAWNYI